jgi:hypothetical protein
MIANETSIACWEPCDSRPAFRPNEIAALIQRVRQPLHIIQEEAAGCIGLGCGGRVCTDGATDDPRIKALFKKFTESVRAVEKAAPPSLEFGRIATSGML